MDKKVKSARFYLKNKKDGWGSIVAIFNFRYIEDEHYRFYQQSSGKEIPVENWGSKLQRIKKGSFHDWDRINRKLNPIENEIIERYDEMVRNNQY